MNITRPRAISSATTESTRGYFVRANPSVRWLWKHLRPHHRCGVRPASRKRPGDPAPGRSTPSAAPIPTRAWRSSAAALRRNSCTGLASSPGSRAAGAISKAATSDVVPWLRALDIFVLPSRSEALSNSLMEAMACGCCPVASDIGGNPELVIPMKTGLLFRQGDAADLAAKLELLAADPALRRSSAARAAAKIAAEFSLQAAGRRMGEIYLSLLPKPTSPRP